MLMSVKNRSRVNSGLQPMIENKLYITKSTKRPLQFWAQPLVLLLVSILLCKLLPLSAVFYKSRNIQPLPAARVSYVKLDPDYAMEVLRASMQTWRSSILSGSTLHGMSMDDVELSVPLGAPLLLKQGSLYPGKWVPGVITPLAQSLPDLLCVTVPAIQDRISDGVKPKSSGVIVRNDSGLRKAGFVFPSELLQKLAGSGRCRYYVECAEDGSVVHILLLESTLENSSVVERALQLGRSKVATEGQVEIMWRNP